MVSSINLALIINHLHFIWRWKIICLEGNNNNNNNNSNVLYILCNIFLKLFNAGNHFISLTYHLFLCMKWEKLTPNIYFYILANDCDF